MKYTTILLALFTFVGCQSKKDFNGLWKAYGYECYGNKIEEIIKLTHQSDSVVAFKLIGDDCIKEGELTWRGILVQDSILGAMVGLIPPSMEKAEVQMIFHIVNNDSIYVQLTPEMRISFSRILIK